MVQNVQCSVNFRVESEELVLISGNRRPNGGTLERRGFGPAASATATGWTLRPGSHFAAGLAGAHPDVWGLMRQPGPGVEQGGRSRPNTASWYAGAMDGCRRCAPA